MAPLSTKLGILAVLYLVLIVTGTFIDHKHMINMELQQEALTQAVGFRRSKNPLL